MDAILSEIRAERERQIEDHGYDENHDSCCTMNDWVAYICAYAGRAADCKRNRGENFRKRMIKVAALAVAAIEAHDNTLMVLRQRQRFRMERDVEP